MSPNALRGVNVAQRHIINGPYTLLLAEAEKRGGDGADTAHGNIPLGVRFLGAAHKFVRHNDARRGWAAGRWLLRFDTLSNEAEGGSHNRLVATFQRFLCGQIVACHIRIEVGDGVDQRALATRRGDLHRIAALARIGADMDALTHEVRTKAEALR